MSQARRKRRFGLRAKLNIVLIACILLITLGLLQITYIVFARKVDSLYFEDARNATYAAANYYLPFDMLSPLWDAINTDEYREVRARAVAAGDEQIILDWMRGQPSPPNYWNTMDEENQSFYSMYEEFFQRSMDDIVETYNVNRAYVQYWSDGVAYTLVDSQGGLLAVGEVNELAAALFGDLGNAQIPPTVYRYENEYLCTACEPVVEGDETVSGQMCVDIDMSEVIRERLWFLLNSAAFATLYTVAAIVASLLLTRKLVTKPLRLLVEGAMGFAKGEAGFSKDDVLRLPIKSNDEIGDLYREIQSMQTRIVDSAERMTKLTAERERVSTELGMATQIQASALPRKFPAFPDRGEFDLYASMDPAKEVGGDFYDFFMIDDDHLALVIADVSDKGVPAALFMMSAKNLINYRAQMGGGPGEILTSVNAQLCEDNKMKMFVTVWLGILEISTGKLTCTNAGHEFPVIRGRDGRFRVFQDRHGVMAGVMARAKYRDYELTLEPGDALFVYTDGVPEANNAAGEMYGMERLEAALNRVAAENPEGILRGVRADVDAFVDGAKQFDDLTMLCLEYRGTNGKEPQSED